MSVTTMRMLRWISSSTLKNRVNDNIQGKLKVAPIEDR